MSDTIKYLQNKNIIPSKKLGQNFLINEDVCQSIVNSVNWKDVDLIIEIGPGMGAITKYLINKEIKYVGIELDKRLYEYLKETFQNNHVSFINDDCLNIKYEQIINKYKNPIIVSNLPYSISAPMIVKFIKEIKINNFYVMLQKELVDRINAKCGTKQFNNFTCLVQYYCQVTKLLNIGKNNFYPVPLIDSTFISLIKNKNPYDANFDKWLKNIFLQKRKTLINNLKGLYDRQLINDNFKKMKLNENIRAEQLTIPIIYELYKLFSKC